MKPIFLWPLLILYLPLACATVKPDTTVPSSPEAAVIRSGRVLLLFACPLSRLIMA